MNQKQRTAIVLVGASLVMVALLVLRGVRERRLAADGSTLTTMDGDWEVPIIEGDEQVESFTLAKNKMFRLRVADAVLELHEGDRASVLWKPGEVFVNDIRVVPHPNERVLLTADEVERRYGAIPTVQQYIVEHKGEAKADEIATRAVEAWYAEVEDVVRQASDRYRESLTQGSARQAAEAAKEVISSSGLADSVAVRLGGPPDSEAQELDVIWDGQRGQPGALTGVLLLTEKSELPPQTVTAKRVYGLLIEHLRLLTYGENELTVRYEGGSLLVEGQVIARPR